MPDFHLFAKGPRPVAPFSHAVETDGWVILTGQMPTDPEAPDGSVAHQAWVACRTHHPPPTPAGGLHPTPTKKGGRSRLPPPPTRSRA